MVKGRIEHEAHARAVGRGGERLKLRQRLRALGANPAAALFFIAINLVAGFFLLELFTGVIIANYYALKDEASGAGVLTEAQVRWVEQVNDGDLHLAPPKVAPGGAQTVNKGAEAVFGFTALAKDAEAKASTSSRLMSMALRGAKNCSTSLREKRRSSARSRVVWLLTSSLAMPMSGTEREPTKIRTLAGTCSNSSRKNASRA